MKLPNWIRAGMTTTSSSPGTVTFEFIADTDAYVAAMLHAQEQTRAAEYRGRIAHEHTRSRAFVGKLLDRLCIDLGFDPDTTWRQPRAAEEAWACDVAKLQALEHLRLQLVGLQPVSSCWGEA